MVKQLKNEHTGGKARVRETSQEHMKLDNRIGKRKNSNIWIKMSWKNEQIKEDKIEKLIESFQKGKSISFLRTKYITISPKGG